MDQLPAGRPFLALPIHQGRWLLALVLLSIAVTVWLAGRHAA
jgi:hypothetical protein